VCSSDLLFAALYIDGRADRHVTVGGIINELPPAPVDPTVWPDTRVYTSVEPGIVASTWLLSHRDGRIFAMTAVFNDQESQVSVQSVGALLTAAVETLHRAAPGFDAETAEEDDKTD